MHGLKKLEADSARGAELWVLEHEFDKTLLNIRTHYTEVLKEFYGEADLFREYFQDKFAELETILQTAAKRKELSVRDFHFQRTELLLSSFRGDDSGILRYVWILHKDEPLFDEKWQAYCDQILRGTTEGAIKGVRALLVLGEGVSEQDLVVRTLAGFYDGAKGHDYRVIEESTYSVQKLDNRIGPEYIDFGIYGGRYIYLTKSYGAVTAGTFCKDKAVIVRYLKFFDSIWTSHFCRKLPKASIIPKVKLDQLFGVHW